MSDIPSTAIPPLPVSITTPASNLDVYDPDYKGKVKATQTSYTLDYVYRISPFFKEKYVVDLKGKPFVQYNGLVLLAKLKGLKSVDVEIIQYPTQDNNHTTICKATVIGWDKGPDGTAVEVKYTEIGDANPGNINKTIIPHAIRMAATRAKGRALRDYLGIDCVMDEEVLSSDVITDSSIRITQGVPKGSGIVPISDTPNMPMTQEQVKELQSLAVTLGWDANMLNQGVAYALQSQTPMDISALDAIQMQNVINYMKQAAGQY